MDLQVFIDLQDKFEKETALNEELRDAIKELEKCCRLASAKFAKSHSLTREQAKELAVSARTQFKAINACITNLAGLIKPETFYRYQDRWTNTMQTACALVVFSTYLEEARLATPEDIEKHLGFKVNTENRDISEFVITLEEYLHGVISLFNELSRLAVNSVIVNDVERPQEIASFASELYSGFQLLNLKNDSLRRRFDSIKYDIKRIEEVQYDLRVRNLN
ncbi:Translin-1 [Coemansia sp. RSA 989]|nr:Translin [Coemansia mojavensis]KAJ1742557.1 Translin-1 [Coemansia sp. RSA 1086]KAJ1751278.1 Translin-1 [Coemansia sp. RSA 1821]KAJ1865710.1 Translin-1 [Coemansia sp. RSA 989]KAJ1872904.1 Translin-1 [Coemansia sp. RSA 990]KAJ2618988.1 Translin-1 [Coemansia sp. RSA 1290]KAJ2647725.1 Translin-1 [Coemansia sp. RSA 1250]KAJ2672082.1 Translin-1 [Coemansia sp. RSA 1085]